jgi:hypothetical protein
VTLHGSINAAGIVLARPHMTSKPDVMASTLSKDRSNGRPGPARSYFELAREGGKTTVRFHCVTYLFRCGVTIDVSVIQLRGRHDQHPPGRVPAFEL